MEGMGAEITGLDEWGTRELAYPIQKQTRGFYVLLQYRGQPGVVKELERNLRISDDVLRYVSVRLPLNRKSPHERTAPVSTESSVEVSPAQEE
jgi:small subunit ribosomal protein S6